jgi:hypothetical protein
MSKQPQHICRAFNDITARPADSHLLRGPHDPAINLAPVGDQDFFEHSISYPVIKGGRAIQSFWPKTRLQ